jgi:hypothetical protein
LTLSEKHRAERQATASKPVLERRHQRIGRLPAAIHASEVRACASIGAFGSVAVILTFTR